MRHWVSGVAFNTLSVEGYGFAEQDQRVSMQGKIFVQSRDAAKRRIWYRLGAPSPEYKRFWKPYVWLATFTKHFVDYLSQ